MIYTIAVGKRGYGWPQAGGFYVLSGTHNQLCYGLPAPLSTCECCGHKPKFARAPSIIQSAWLRQIVEENCNTILHNSFHKCSGACIHTARTYWLSWIGSDYDAKSFLVELRTLGLSRRIAPSFIDKIQIGDNIVCIKDEMIIAIVPITQKRYYVKPGEKDDTTKIKELEKKNIICCKYEKLPYARIIFNMGFAKRNS